MNRALKAVIALVVLILLTWFCLWWLSKKVANYQQPVLASRQSGVSSTAETTPIKLYMIEPADDCSVDVAEVTRIVAGGDLLDQTYYELLGLHSLDYGESGLTNALWQSSLTLQAANVGADGVAHVELAGTLVPTSQCDALRIKTQLEKPALQFTGVIGVDVVVNGQPLDIALSMQ